MFKGTAHFQPDEFDCKSTPGSGVHMSPAFVDKLENLRAAVADSLGWEVPFEINSGYRTPEYNAAVSDTGMHGPHTTGRAVDIHIFGQEAFLIASLAKSCGFTGIGVSQKGPIGSRFIHLDDLTKEDGFPRPRLWSY